jgi:hypothetical protein
MSSGSELGVAFVEIVCSEFVIRMAIALGRSLWDDR